MGFDDFADFDDGFSGAEVLFGMGVAANMGYALAEDGCRLAEEEAAEERRCQRVREILYGGDDEDLDDEEDDWDEDYRSRLRRYSDDDDDDWDDEWEKEDEDDDDDDW